MLMSWPLISVAENNGADDVDDTRTRLNPEMAAERPGSGVNNTSYPFINHRANIILMNGDSWQTLADKFDMISQGHTVNIVHIGDSHIQAEGNTSQVRKLMQQRYGNAGRGMIIPFRLAGTNQPLDYKISCTSTLTTAKILKKPWPTDMGFTGISLALPAGDVGFSIKAPGEFSKITVMTIGQVNVTSVKSAAESIGFRQIHTKHGTVVELDKACQDVTIHVSGNGGNILGFYLRNEKSGVIYSGIGNNGACFSSYSDIPGMGEGVSALEPDLIIVSLGTNEAFGKVSDATFYNQIRKLVNTLREHNKGAKLLLVTPSECQRSVYSTVVSRKRRRRRTRRVRSYAVNSNVARMRDVILRFGQENHIPVYDFYEVAGGKGASDKWLKNKLLSPDRIHRTWAGYRLEGNLLYDALLTALGNPPQETPVQVVPESYERVDTKSNISDSRTQNATAKKNGKAGKKVSGKKSKYKKSKSSKKKRKKKSSKKRRRR